MTLRKKLAELLGRGRRVEAASLTVEGPMPDFGGIGPWLNSGPLTAAALASRVVLVDFWTYSCINCLRTLPHLQAWHETYGGSGLTIIGVHTPEFDFEKDPDNVRLAIARYGLTYPVVLDNDYTLWNRYRNRAWPAHYFIDANGNIRYRHFGEGEYAHSEEVLRTLLAEVGRTLPAEPVHLAEPALACERQLTPETYLGSDRLEYLGSPEPVRAEVPQLYSSVARPGLGIFYLAGQWRIDPDCIIPAGLPAKLIFRCRAASINLVAAPGAAPGCRINIRLDGRALKASENGGDAVIENDASYAVIDEARLYRLVDCGAVCGEHLLELEVDRPGVKLYSFTFG